jgi:nucleotide-binding universal stress UspA family protein
MPTIKHILFPFDFSKQASVAVPFVRAIASKYDAEISVLAVISPAWNKPPGGMPPLPGLDAPEHELRAQLDQALAQEFAGLVTRHLADLGDPALKIIEVAHREDVDLIMMPTHGISGYRTMLLGSVTAKVLYEAKCPVWTATHAEEQMSPAAPRTMVCAIDDSPRTVTVMRWASEFGQRMSAALSFLHVVAPTGDTRTVPSEQEIRRGAHAKLESIQQTAGVQGRLQVAAGEIAETITEETRRQGADLILIGRGLLPSPLGRLRSEAYAIIRQSPCPVVSI